MFLARRSLGIAYTPLTRRLSSRASSVLGALDIPTTPTELPGVYDGEWKGSGDILQSVCPTTGEVLAHVKTVRFLSSVSVRARTCSNLQASPAELHAALERTREAYVYFRSIPAPRRGEIIRQIREALAAKVRVLSCVYVVMRRSLVAAR
jgi:aldehyde dehydrogenase family 7 protein A1